MRNIIATLSLLVVAMTASAQQYMRIWQGGDDIRVNLEDITYSNNGATLTAAGRDYQTSSIDSITMVHVITVTFDGDKATIEQGNVLGVTCTQDGANVIINNTNTFNELEMVLQGQSSNGSLTYYGSYKCKFYLNGLDLTSTTGAALDIQCGKRIDLILPEGTDNKLSDAAGGTQKAALYCRGHLEVEGGGSLTVTGNTRHAIATKEYLQLKKSTGNITINHAEGDAMHVGQYFLMSGGTVNISGQTGDGIQTEILTLADNITPNPDKENNGQINIKGGAITIAVAADDTKGIKAATDMTVNGGTFTINASGKGSKGISVAGNMLVNEDTDKTLMTIRATGAKYSDAETEEETRCMGIKVSGDLTVTAGTIRVSNTGSGSRGIKIDGTYTKTGTASVIGNIKN